jgi:hypothetical protein
MSSPKVFVFEHAEEYVKALEISTLLALGLREVFDHCAEG